MKSIKIKNKEIKIPIIQGGMGVGVSRKNLASAVINEGAVGTISAAQIGFEHEDFNKNIRLSHKCNVIELANQIKEVRKKTPESGFLAVNILTAHRQYGELAASAVSAGADAIISGAGLPLELPKYTKDSQTAAIPIVANSRVLRIIMKSWKKKYDVEPDAVVVEGPKAGGHLGIKYEDIGKKETTLEERLDDVLTFMKDNNYNFPVFVAGGVFTSADVKKFIDLGANGVQIGTRFIATEECDAHPNFKQKIIDSKKEDITYVKSPVGYPARAIRNSFVELSEKGNVPVEKCLGCVKPCQGKVPSTVYCITDYLIRAVQGDVENGLVFSGENGYRVKEMTTVHKLIEELIEDIR